MNTVSYVERSPVLADNQRRTDGFILRSGKVEDAEALASLFRISYGETTHPCQNTRYIYNAIISELQEWFVLENDASIVGCSCIARRTWNRTWESCYGVVHPGARRSGGISSLIKLSFEGFDPDPIEIGFYVPRSRAIYSIMSQIRKGVLVGHDGGPNTVDGIREYHFTAIHPPAADGFSHIAPSYVSELKSSFIKDHLYDPLGLQPINGDYPNTYFTGPSDTEEHGSFLYSCDAVADAFTVSGYTGAATTEREVFLELKSAIATWETSAYIGAYMLADKVELISQMVKLGFVMTAYLPAWHLHAGVRFDCVMLVRHRFLQPPQSHGFDHEVAFFDQAYSELTQSLCLIGRNN
ncbi:hypothetical protein POF45_20350 [Pseudomonas sp. 681]|uniref:N-acetyltransferase domain-containing protein n=1 Tax=Pseudomonas fungipugnans TaxID=3024217 RepID=A0ABT6QS73_9PSED|nr:hypothetical protein [Pseudomonas sp. 681]MDI2593753.1 hypothetical protein [Pseudomonas sp. 681]